jgi:MoxR-like ATPase
VATDVLAYLVSVTRATRTDPDVRLGASPRATLALYRAVQTWAAMQGRDYVLPDDVKRLAGPVLAHRVVVTIEARLRGRSAATVVDGVLRAVAVPVEVGA